MVLQVLLIGHASRPSVDGSFSPFAERPGVIDWFTITIGLEPF